MGDPGRQCEARGPLPGPRGHLDRRDPAAGVLGLGRRRHARAQRRRATADLEAGRAEREGEDVIGLVLHDPPGAGRSRELVHLSDEALLSLVATSDEDALAELYDSFGGVAYGLALRILRDEALAQDAVQEAFLSVWRTADRFLAERARASTWILTIVHRRAVDLVRRQERRSAEPVETAPEPPAPELVEEQATVRFQRRIVQEALQRLPSEQRQALELSYYGGLTQSELAAKTGQPLGTIKSRTFAGLARLRDLLAQAGLEESLRT